MSMPAKILNLTVEEYLAAEETAKVRHEYVDGQIYAMTGATDNHNRICGNIFAFLHSHLKTAGCQPYINNMKVRIEATNCFYYPDILISCEAYDGKSVYKSEPVAILEVLSPSTSKIDLREKLIAYKQIPSLREYGLVYQDQQRIELHRRISERLWQSLTILPPDQLMLSSCTDPLHIPLSEIYDRTDIK